MTETIISLKTMHTYEITLKHGSENAMICPECSHNRRSKNQKAKCFSYNVLAYCMVMRVGVQPSSESFEHSLLSMVLRDDGW